MKIHTIRTGIGFLLLASLSTGNAFVGTPELIPDQPTEEDIVAITIASGHCDGLFATDSKISQQGASIRVVIPGVQSTLFCSFPVVEDTIPIGALPAGSYTLQVDYGHYPPGDPGNVTVETIGIINFNVAAAPGGVAATPVPTSGDVGGIILGLILLALAWPGLRRRGGRPASNCR